MEFFWLYFDIYFSYDLDNLRVFGDVGMVGVVVDLVEDMKVYIDLFKYDVCIFIVIRIMLWFFGVL